MLVRLHRAILAFGILITPALASAARSPECVRWLNQDSTGSESIDTATFTTFAEEVRTIRATCANNQCNTNVARILESSASLPRDSEVLLIYPKNPFDNLYPQGAARDVTGWRFHVVLFIRGHVVDVDRKGTQIFTPADEYFLGMFGTKNIALSEIGVKTVPATEYLGRRKKYGYAHYLYEIWEDPDASAMDFIRARQPNFTQTANVLRSNPPSHLSGVHRLRHYNAQELSDLGRGKGVRFDYLFTSTSDAASAVPRNISGQLVDFNDRMATLRLSDGAEQRIPLELIYTETITEK